MKQKKIVEICKKNKIKLFVNYFRISDPSTQVLKKKFVKKKIFLAIYIIQEDTLIIVHIF